MREKHRIKTIGIAFNLKRNTADDHQEEYDAPETIQAIREEIERLGFKAALLEQDEHFFNNLLKARPDFVFNIAEGIGRGRSRESQVPGILESLKIPYSGSDPVALGICLDKYLTNRFLDNAGIPVPRMRIVRSEKELLGLADIFRYGGYVVVKPCWEGSSKGIANDSLVNNPTALRKKCRQIFIRYKQPAVIESFLEGSEITAGVCGNLPFPGLLGMMKIIPKNVSEKFFLYSLENKRDWENRIHYEGQSSISPGIQTRVKTCSLKAFTVLELRDIARIDFRIGKDRIPRIIDVNPLPGLSPVYGDLPILCRLSGKSYRELIYRLIAASFERYGFNPPDRHSSKGTA